ncbi:hypothetical protein EON64_20680, partial [archaeon]
MPNALLYSSNTQPHSSTSNTSESTLLLWDLNAATPTASRLPLTEAVTSLSFLPNHAFLLAAGSALGVARLLDLRMHQSAVLSWLPHPSNRPRRVAGLRVSSSSALLASFSDAPQDAVKLWDLRQLPAASSQKA